MLTREHAIAAYESGQIYPDRLTQNRNAHYVGMIDRVLALYRSGVGRTRRELHRDVRSIFGEELECPVRRIEAFCKLLDERATYDRDRRGRAAELRKRVFRLANRHHPLVEQADRLFESAESDVKQEIASQLGMSWKEIERELFSDIIEFHRLKEFEGYANAIELLSRYNVAQCQAVLYDAISMTVWATEDFKTIVRYAKLARLMHSIVQHPGGGYVFQFAGPVSVLRSSRRYGVALAKFLPALLSCRGWRMQAKIEHRRSHWQSLFRLSPADGLTSKRPDPKVFDSTLEEKFAARWGNDSREGWTLIHEGELLHAGQKVFVPDFVFQHENGFRVVMEIVGFWTPEYLAAKRETLALFSEHDILLVIAEAIDWPANAAGPDELPESGLKETGDSLATGGSDEMIRYKTVVRVDDVLAQLQRRLEKSRT